MTSTISSNKVAVKWSLISVIVSIVLTYTYQFLNIDQSSGVKYIGLIPYIAFMFLAQKEYKDLIVYPTFGQSFMTGFKYVIITLVLGSIFTYIYWTLLSPQIFQALVDTAKQQAEAKGAELPAIFTSAGFYIILGAIFSLIAGIIIALIGAAIFKKDKPPFATDENVPYSDPAV